MPDDVLAYLGQYNQHWWFVRGSYVETKYREVRTLAPAKGITLIETSTSDQNRSVSVPYSDSILISSKGVVSLGSTKTVDVSYNTLYEAAETIRDKYISLNGAIMYVPSGFTFSGGWDDDNSRVFVQVNANTLYAVSTEAYTETITTDGSYLQSADRNAYPDSGVVDGTEYRYLGVPFENAVTAPKIETGSYVGTGKCGVSNKNTLTFGFEPKMVIVHQDATMMFNSNGGLQSTLFWVKGVATQYNGSTSNDVIVNFTQSGNTFSYYITSTNTGNANFQMNASGKTYHYLAIG